MTSSQEIVQKYRENLSSFADFLKQIIEICIEEEVTTLSVTVIDEFKTLLETADVAEVIEKFLLISRNGSGNNKPFLVWEQIRSRDEKHLLSSLASLIPEEHRNNVKPYLNLLTVHDQDGDRIVDDEYQKVLWEYCDSFVSLSIRFLHLRRTPCLKDNEVKTYKNKYLPVIQNKELVSFAKMFRVKLKW